MNKPSLQDDDFTRKLQRIDAQISAGQLAQAAQALNAARGKHARDPRLYLIGMRLAEKPATRPVRWPPPSAPCNWRRNGR